MGPGARKEYSSRFAPSAADSEQRVVFVLSWRAMGGLSALVLPDPFVEQEDDGIARSAAEVLPALARVVRADAHSLVALSDDLIRSGGGFDRQSRRRCAGWMPEEMRKPRLQFSRWYITRGTVTMSSDRSGPRADTSLPAPSSALSLQR
jgi:hypothetical protein